MSLDKLISIRQRLSEITLQEPADAARATEKPAEETKAEKELKAVLKSIDELIVDYKREWLTNSNIERELQRTTSKPIEPPSKPGPHEIKW